VNINLEEKKEQKKILFSKCISTRYMNSLLLYIHWDTIMFLTNLQLFENNQQNFKITGRMVT
jgi:hypothetical protein